MSQPSVDRPFEPSALQFLLQWLRTESQLHSDVSVNQSLDSIRKSLHHFKVSRSFSGLADDANANKIRERLRKVLGQDTSSVKKVRRLAEYFEKDGFGFNLSAASKLVWLADRSAIIYDSRALDALQKLSSSIAIKGDYDAYCIQWVRAYARSRASVSAASSGLTAIQQYLPWPSLPKKQLKTLVHRRWFRERVFDSWLHAQGVAPNVRQSLA